MDKVTVRFSGRRQAVGWDEAGHTVVLDARSEHAGDDAGIRPLQAFLCAMAGCTGMDVLSILEKKRQDVRRLEIKVEADQREDEYPKIYTDIRLHYVVTGYGVTDSAVSRSIELSEEKYCTVKGMLGPQTQVHTSFEVREASEPGTASP